MSRRARLGLGLGLGLGGGLGLAAPAHAGPLAWAAELRSAGLFSAATEGQFGSDDPAQSPCGPQPIYDGGGQVSATAVGIAQARTYRYQLALSAGYVAMRCTPILRRPTFGIDYRGEHTVRERTRITSALRANVDVFDRTLDIRTGTLTPGDGTPMQPPAAGTRFFAGTAALDVEHTLPGRHGLRAGLELRSLELLDPLHTQSPYSTLGPMLSAGFSAGWFRDRPKSRLEVPLRYRVTALYPATFQGLVERADVPAAHDADLRIQGQLRPRPGWTLTGALGAGLTYQPQLCIQLDPALRKDDRCSADARAPGIIGLDGAPPVELQLGRRGTLAPVGELSASYAAPRQRFELRLARAYDPDPYGGSLALTERLAADHAVRPDRDLLVYSAVQLAHVAEASPARIAGAPDTELQIAQLLSPQNRTMWMAQGLVGVDRFVARPLALFAELNASAMAIRGERVPTAQPGVEVGAFPGDPARPDQRYQVTARVNVLVGLRVAYESSTRDREVLASARAVP